MSEKFIQPTGTCFTDALEFITLYAPTYNAEELQLVHAICKMRSSGTLYAHAWVNDLIRGVTFFAGIIDGERNYFSADTEQFEIAAHIVEATRYTMDEAFAENLRTGHYGPWIDRYLALCKPARKT